jgi:hypothetical protein
MDKRWSNALWQQFGAAIDMLENALRACPPASWEKRLWGDPALPETSAEFWYTAFHTLYWLDFYLAGTTEGFTLPPPFTRNPQQPYTQDELLVYLAYTRQKCQTTIAALSDETAAQPFEFPWEPGKPISFLELLLYTMRHVQEHAAQLSLFLGQDASDAQAHATLDNALDWVPRARSDHPNT